MLENNYKKANIEECNYSNVYNDIKKIFNKIGIYLNEKDDICNPKEVDEDRTFDDVLHDVLLAYLTESKIINDKFGELTINSYNQDSENNNECYDYFMFTCGLTKLYSLHCLVCCVL